jgi:hypothetical protein
MLWYFLNPNKVLDDLYQQAMNLLEGYFLYSVIEQELDDLPIVQQGIKSGLGVDLDLAKTILLDFAKLHLIALRVEAYEEENVDQLINDYVKPAVVESYESAENSIEYLRLMLFPSVYGAWFNKLIKLDDLYVLNKEKKLRTNRFITSIKILKDCKRPSQKVVYNATEYITINGNAVYDLIGKGLKRNGII